MSLHETAGYKSWSEPLKAIGLSGNAYVLCLASLSDYYAAAASAPSNVIDVFDKSSLRHIQTLAGHRDATTSLQSVDRIAGRMHESLLSSGRDGVLRVWDVRSNTASIEMSNASRSQPLLCCDVSSDGLTIAAGSVLQGEDALILYFDPRCPNAPLRTHGSTHSDDITTVQFSTTTASDCRNVLLSASSDGLLSLSNADEVDEDEAVLSVGNWGCSVAQAGWIQGPTGPNIWAASDMETFTVWSNELDMLSNVDIRSPSIQSQNCTWSTDYLISPKNSPSMSNFGLLVGSNDGDVALINSSNYSKSDSSWNIHRKYTSGHTGIVRAAIYDESNNVVLTGGEDSRINVWSNSVYTSTPESSNTDAMDVDAPTRKRTIDMVPVSKGDLAEPVGKRGRQ